MTDTQGHEPGAMVTSPLRSDLVHDSRLPTEFVAQGIQNTTWAYRHTSGRRRVRQDELWRRQRKLGDGAFGRVWLETSVTGPAPGRLRALKVVRKDLNPIMVDYTRELEAAAKFSHDRVRL